ncbi:MAG: M28 family peptidase, partial [Thermomicrobiales bacterium]
MNPARPQRHVAHPLALLTGLVLLAVTLGLVVAAAQPPAPKGETAPADEFSAARAMAVLERLLGDGAPHQTGSQANARVAERIGDELAALGYPVETQSTFACRVAWAVCGSVSNIITRLPGAADGPAVLLTAHYDSVAASPGAADD